MRRAGSPRWGRAGPRQTRELIAALGGAQRVADMTGRSLRTVQRWASEQITEAELSSSKLEWLLIGGAL